MEENNQRLVSGLLVVAVVAVVAIIGYLLWQNQITIPNDDQPAVTDETPTVSADEALATVFTDKYGADTTVAITSRDETHVRGTYDPAGTIEGGMFLATVVNGSWALVFEAGANTDCTAMKQFGFSDEMLADCYDNAEENRATCQIDADCVPLPVCHPRNCINKVFADKYQQPEFCTKQFDYQAAYTAADCACQQSLCVNKNLGRTTLPE